ncbi:hypothetical protein [Oceanobacillus sp. CAU 1775]
MTAVIVLFMLFIINSFYKRYVPIFGFTCIELDKISGNTDTVVVDVRDYSIAHRFPVEGAVNIPFSYLKRYYHDIKHRNIFLVASELIDIKLSVRFLAKKGIEINGYYLEQDSEKQSKKYCCRKRRENHGIQCPNEK